MQQFLFYFYFFLHKVGWGGICSLVLFMRFSPPYKKWVERGFISKLFLWEDWAVPLSQRHVI